MKECGINLVSSVCQSKIFSKTVKFLGKNYNILQKNKHKFSIFTFIHISFNIFFDLIINILNIIKNILQNLIN